MEGMGGNKMIKPCYKRLVYYSMYHLVAIVHSRNNIHVNHPTSYIWLEHEARRQWIREFPRLVGAPFDSLNLGNWARPRAKTRGLNSLVSSEDRHQLCYFQIHLINRHRGIKFYCINLTELLKDWVKYIKLLNRCLTHGKYTTVVLIAY